MSSEPGSLFRIFDSLASTSDTLRTLAAEGAPHGTVVRALRQTAGRGRRGRSWFSPSDGALLMSVLLKPEGALERLPALSLEVGAALVEVVANLGVRARVKWPNDILVDDLKLAGILCELTEDSRGAPAVIVGIGLNANIARSTFPAELQEVATSLLAITGAAVDMDSLSHTIAARVLTEFRRFDIEGLDRGRAEALSATVGTLVRDESGRVGRALRITGRGTLEVLWHGALKPAEVVAGDIVRAEAAPARR